ncbi:glycoside hydrolase family 108 protein [uncultured Desulfovibrio sp.]|uniref:glycoside hydrolase family 108 protein n=1 Tax=uncultured Desulfovibrio sp. TaxID=167968 RepID=UPI0026151AF6|nr:glycosyl hydrolase 108 family protein [uncultured Desulfovibrio sp.]
MSASFEKAYAPLAAFEGGYANDPSDRGGETYAGIARNFFPEWPGWAIVDKWKKSLGENAAVLTRALATAPDLQELVADWYRAEWWDRLGLASLPQALADEIFEQSINLGKAGAGKKVQIVCNAYNRGRDGKPLFADLAVDGAIGPRTLNALRLLIERRMDAYGLVHALNCMQGAHYLELAAGRPGQRKFTSGWMSRTRCPDESH